MDATRANYYVWRSNALDEESSAALKAVLEGKGKYLACEAGKFVVKEQGVWQKFLALFHSSYALVSWAAQDLLKAKMQDKTPHTNKWIVMDQTLVDQFGGEKIGGIIGKVFGEAEHPYKISREKGYHFGEITLQDIVNLEGVDDVPGIIDRGVLTIDEVIGKFLPSNLPTDLTGLLKELKERKFIPRSTYHQTFTDVRDRLLKGQGWREKGPLEEPSQMILKDIGRITYGMKGDKPLYKEGDPGDPEQKVQEFKQECLKRNLKLTKQQLNLVAELMSQTPLADVLEQFQLLITELLIKGYLLNFTERTIEVDVREDKVLVEVNFEPLIRNTRSASVESHELKVKATFTLDLSVPLKEGSGDVLEVKIENSL